MAKMNGVAFENLRVEMARKNITITKIAEFLGVTRDTAGNKLARKGPIYLDEALRIARNFFPGCDVYYLFQELVPKENQSKAG